MEVQYSSMPDGMTGNDNGQGTDNNDGFEHNTLQELPAEPRARYTCTTCSKQKRKCDKRLPSCLRCVKNNKICIYSRPQARPTQEDIVALQNEVEMIKGKMGQTGQVTGLQSYPFSTDPTGATFNGLADGQRDVASSYHPVPQNKGLTIAFLDKSSFVSGGLNVTSPSVEIPQEVRQHVDDTHAIAIKYFQTIDAWMPIIPRRIIEDNLNIPIDQMRPDMAMLFLSMKLVTSIPPDGVHGSQTPLYGCIKRFSSVTEAAGTLTLELLQANVLKFWYEYGHAIYPAAHFTAVWCTSYRNLLGFDSPGQESTLLGSTDSAIEKETRTRIWWGVMITQQAVSVGNKASFKVAQYPLEYAALPGDDVAWANDEMHPDASPPHSLGSFDTVVSSFARICQATYLISEVFFHLQTTSSSLDIAARSTQAESLLAAATELRGEIHKGPAGSMGLMAASAFVNHAIQMLSSHYCKQNTEIFKPTIRVLIDSINSIFHLGSRLDNMTQSPEEVDKVSPIALATLYSGATSISWYAKHPQERQEDEGEPILNTQLALNTIMQWFDKYGGRWRVAGEYQNLLGADMMSSFAAVGGASTSS